MADHLRILIADQNRYHCLLIEREIHHRFPSCVTTIFRSAKDTLDELNRNRYSAAVIDASVSDSVYSNMPAEIRKRSQNLPLLLTVPPDVILPDQDSLYDDLTTIVLKDGRMIERQGVATSVLKHENHAWKIVRYHSSSRAPRKTNR